MDEYRFCAPPITNPPPLIQYGPSLFVLQGAPLAYTPFCDNNKEMDEYRFWKGGFWRDHLQGKPYHISALYLVDLNRFRTVAAGGGWNPTGWVGGRRQLGGWDGRLVGPELQDGGGGVGGWTSTGSGRWRRVLACGPSWNLHTSFCAACRAPCCALLPHAVPCCAVTRRPVPRGVQAAVQPPCTHTPCCAVLPHAAPCRAVTAVLTCRRPVPCRVRAAVQGPQQPG